MLPGCPVEIGPRAAAASVAAAVLRTVCLAVASPPSLVIARQGQRRPRVSPAAVPELTVTDHDDLLTPPSPSPAPRCLLLSPAVPRAPPVAVVFTVHQLTSAAAREAHTDRTDGLAVGCRGRTPRRAQLESVPTAYGWRISAAGVLCGHIAV